MLKLDRSKFNHQFNGYKLKQKPKTDAFPIDMLQIEYSPLCPYPILEFVARYNSIFYNGDLYYFNSAMQLCKTCTALENCESTKIHDFQAPIADQFPPSIAFTNDLTLVYPGNESILYIFSNDVLLTTINVPFTDRSTLLSAYAKEDDIFVLFGTLSKDKKFPIHVLMGRISLDYNFEIQCSLVGQRIPFFTQINKEQFTILSEFPMKRSVTDDLVDIDAKLAESENVKTGVDYIWQQDEDQVTIHIILPVHTNRAAINCMFTSNSVKVNDYIQGKLYSPILPSECVWTLESNQYLTLYLQKTNQYRWQHVFEKDDGVLETIDSSLLAEFKERLEKYSGDEGRREMIAFTEQTEDIDFENESVSLNMFSLTGEILKSNNTSGMKFICNFGEGFVLKSDVDGVLFELEGLNTVHVGCFNAIGYVYASKQNSRIAISRNGGYCLIMGNNIYGYINSSGNSGDSFLLDGGAVLGCHLASTFGLVFFNDFALKIEF
ncbi:NudC domain-containing protein 1 [Boothiomyces sp. JEL0866]|nr:NudC domain-containing protein 1 [Boothiomyces sp. JEL0866]